jgi:uncharacterized protein YyaL (SSP411 family)
MTTPDAADPTLTRALAASPYLRRHAAHPVAWLPWGRQAIERARELDRPLLLVIGRGSSEACRRMARDCFEDPATAALMNEGFVNVVVDAEQRPDVDRCYQAAHSLLTQQPEDWPLTLFLSPRDLVPFFGGTRLAAVAERNRPGFAQILQRVARLWRERPEQVAAQNAALRASLDGLLPPPAPPDAVLDDGVRQASRAALERQFDRRSGGFGAAPKFPYPASLERLLRDWRRTATRLEPDLQALYMVALTLTRVAEGGLRDADGGFFHYALDADWALPLRERRLADNGALLAVYAQAAIATGDPLFASVAGSTADWLLRTLQSPDGGFRAGIESPADGSAGAQREPAVPDAQIAVAGNALAVRGLALASRALRRRDLAEAAARAVDDLRAGLWRQGRLVAARPEGAEPAPELPRATLDDHALFADALVELAQALPRDGDLELARQLLDTLLAHFADARDGGFFHTADDADPLIHRPKVFADGATPSGNGVAARTLLRLGWLFDEPRFLEAAGRTLGAAWPSMQRYPQAHASMIGALEEWLEPPEIVTLQGPPADTARWREELDRIYGPSRIVVAAASQGAVSATVRRGGASSGTLDSLERLARQLRLGLADEPQANRAGE